MPYPHKRQLYSRRAGRSRRRRLKPFSLDINSASLAALERSPRRPATRTSHRSNRIKAPRRRSDTRHCTALFRTRPLVPGQHCGRTGVCRERFGSRPVIDEKQPRQGRGLRAFLRSSCDSEGFDAGVALRSPCSSQPSCGQRSACIGARPSLRSAPAAGAVHPMGTRALRPFAPPLRPRAVRAKTSVQATSGGGTVSRSVGRGRCGFCLLLELAWDPQ
jgi:hypothetical protein